MLAVMRLLLFFSESKVSDIQEMQRARVALKAMARCVEAWFAPECVREWALDKVDDWALVAQVAQTSHFAAYPLPEGEGAKPKWHMLGHLPRPYMGKLPYECRCL